MLNGALRAKRPVIFLVIILSIPPNPSRCGRREKREKIDGSDVLLIQCLQWLLVSSADYSAALSGRAPMTKVFPGRR